MTKFEQIKRNTIVYCEKRIKELTEEIETRKATSIQDYIQKHIVDVGYGEYIFEFSQDPYQYISMRNKDALVEMAKLYLLQEVGDGQ